MKSMWLRVGRLWVAVGASMALSLAGAAGAQEEGGHRMDRPGASAALAADGVRLDSLGPYLMGREAEIALARSAAPASIAGAAEILVLGSAGFETAVAGKNGFVCLVERSWTSAAEADFWNARIRTPICWNAPGARSLLVRNLRRTELILAGRTQAETDTDVVGAVDRRELPPVENLSMNYMMSKLGDGGHDEPPGPSHLMFYFPETDAAVWGAGLPGSPLLGITDPREHVTMFVVAVGQWSDGSDAHEASSWSARTPTSAASTTEARSRSPRGR
jgi:hypothetical protein